jgi:hypothetical protein
MEMELVMSLKSLDVQTQHLARMIQLLRTKMEVAITVATEVTMLLVTAFPSKKQELHLREQFTACI